MASPGSAAGRPRRIGVISDTHGLLRPEAIDALAGCESIIHAGDLGQAAVLQSLRALGPPVLAVRGNVDHGPWAGLLPETVTTHCGVVRIYVLHDLKALAIDPVERGIRVVISGHSHQPCIEERAGVLYLNPGSAGPRRFRLPVTVATLHIAADGGVSARLLPLDEASRHGLA